MDKGIVVPLTLVSYVCSFLAIDVNTSSAAIPEITDNLFFAVQALRLDSNERINVSKICLAKNL
ncbi:unnamed protein product [Ceratitis capitata]|uniref:(Mediterranean fruit fly) hypothetical protein n=1 Tax=Ceratitis capitata TaxID=7213 RepID=A0A811UMK6_CERCA|nr:unnamed protein product [Ceratitis capitata]